MKKLFYIWDVGLLLSPANQQNKNPSVGQIKTPCEILSGSNDETPNHKKVSFNWLIMTDIGIHHLQPGWLKILLLRAVAQIHPQDLQIHCTLLKPEFVPSIRHVYGAVGAGQDNNPQMLSARCQFYIVQNKKVSQGLMISLLYSARCLKGMDVVDSIVSVKRIAWMPH